MTNIYFMKILQTKSTPSGYYIKPICFIHIFTVIEIIRIYVSVVNQVPIFIIVIFLASWVGAFHNDLKSSIFYADRQGRVPY